MELDKLRPEVREAVVCMDSCATIKPACGDGFMNEPWLTIRAELLRLATIEADALIALDCEHDWQVEHKRAETRRREDAERAAAEKKLREEREAAAAERARLEAEKKAQAKREREQAIANATLHAAAADAVELLRSEGFGEHLVTLKLAAALNRESQRKVA